MNNSSNSCVPVQDILVEYHSLTRFFGLKLVFIFIYSLIFVLGIGGNTFVLIAVYRYRSLQSLRNFFIVNLSISDICVCSLSLPVSAHVALNVVWVFGGVTCIVVPTMQGTSVFISTFTLACIAIDRYILLVHINWRPITKAQTLAMITFVWCFAIVLSSPIGVSSRLGRHEDLCGEFCVEERWDPRTRRWYGGVLLVLQFVIPFSIITFCYVSIIRKINLSVVNRKRMANQNSLTATTGLEMPSRQSSGRRIINQLRVRSSRKSVDQSRTFPAPSGRRSSTSDRRQKSNQMQIAMVLMFAISAFPQVIFNVLRDLNQLPAYVREQSHFFTLIVHSIMMTATIWNPFLYGFMNTNFRAAFVDMTRCFRPGGRLGRTPAPSVKSRRPSDYQVVNGSNMHNRSDLIRMEGTDKEMSDVLL